MALNQNKYPARIYFFLLVFISSFHLTAQEVTPVETNSSSVRMVPDSVVNKMQKEKDFLYANDPSFWKEEKPPENGFANFLEKIARSPFLKWTFYLIVAAVIILVLYQVIVVNNFFIFSGRGKRKKADEAAIDSDDPENIDEKIREAVAGKQYRLAIRYMYLKTLHLLNEKQMIRLHARSTNRDYILQMQQHKDAGDFKMLTHIYEYVWYGEFHPSDNQFEFIHTNFNEFISRH